MSNASPIPPPESVDARVTSVIEVRFRRGQGVTADPVRIVIAYFAPDGTFLAEHDPVITDGHQEPQPVRPDPGWPGVLP